MWSGGGDGVGRESYGSNGSNGYTCLQTVASVRTLFSRHHCFINRYLDTGTPSGRNKECIPSHTYSVFENYALLSCYDTTPICDQSVRSVLYLANLVPLQEGLNGVSAFTVNG